MRAQRSRQPGLERLARLARLVADVEAARSLQAQAALARLQTRRDGLDAALQAGLAQDGTATVARYAMWTTRARADLNRQMLAAVPETEDAALTAALSEARAQALARLATRSRRAGR